MNAEAAGTLQLRGIPVRRIGFGALHLSEMERPADAKALLHKVLDLGINLIDTADVYGHGASESYIAEALHPYPSNLLLTTKGGLAWEGDSLVPEGRPERLRAACEGSLTRLSVECVDLYQLHSPDPAVPLEESLGALVELRSEGKVREIGVSNVSDEQLRLARSITEIASVQCGYNLNRLGPKGPRKVLAVCEQDGLPFMAWHPLANGELPYRSERPSSEIIDRIAAQHGATRAQVALAWLLQHSPVTLPIPGTTTLEHLQENVEAASLRLTGAELESLYNHARPDSERGSRSPAQSHASDH